MILRNKYEGTRDTGDSPNFTTNFTTDSPNFTTTFTSNFNSDTSFNSIPNQDNKNGFIEDHEYIEDKHLKYFKIIRTLGTGSSSKVVLGININNNEKVAIKIVPRGNENNNTNNNENNTNNTNNTNISSSSIRIYREIIMSSLLNHPYIVRLKDFFYSSSYFFLIFEYVRGKQLYEIIVNEGELDEKAARRYFRQLVSAIDYIHRNSIVHRDLKIENILVDEFGNVKLIDFGLSNFYDNKMLLNTFCGSLYFAAPELLLGNRYSGPEIDVWSLGVILFVTLNGCVPFDDKDVISLQEKIKEGVFEYKNNLSEEVKELIGSMLQPNPSSRYTLDQIMSSTWLNEGHESRVDNFMMKRYPLKSVNPEYLRVISTAISFQFKNLEREVLKYSKICIQKDGSLEEVYWSKRPSISLYYLLTENLETGGSKHNKGRCNNNDNDNNDNDDNNDNNDNNKFIPINNSNLEMDEVVNRFVNYVISKEKGSPCSKYYKQTVFKTATINEGASPSSFRLVDYPRVRSTYVKGFFKGIKVKHIGTQNALKKTMLDIFNRNRIQYEVTDKYFFCRIVDKDIECTFKVSMYFNIILSEYYVGVHFLDGDRELFQEIHEEIHECIKERPN